MTQNALQSWQFNKCSNGTNKQLTTEHEDTKSLKFVTRHYSEQAKSNFNPPQLIPFAFQASIWTYWNSVYVLLMNLSNSGPFC